MHRDWGSCLLDWGMRGYCVLFCLCRQIFIVSTGLSWVGTPIGRRTCMVFEGTKSWYRSLPVTLTETCVCVHRNELELYYLYTILWILYKKFSIIFIKNINAQKVGSRNCVAWMFSQRRFHISARINCQRAIAL